MPRERLLTARSAAVRNGSNCPFTGAPFQAGNRAVACPKCNTLHESASWRSNNNGCAQFNCLGRGRIVSLWEQGGLVVLLVALLLYGLVNSGALSGSEAVIAAAMTATPTAAEATARLSTATPPPEATPRPPTTTPRPPTATRRAPTTTPRPPKPKPRPSTATPRPAVIAPVAAWGWQEIGRSADGQTLQAARFGDGPTAVVFIGGLHAGFAPATVQLAESLIDRFRNEPSLLPGNLTVYVVPSVNVDAPYDPGELPGRLNANGVDLNRNWDCKWTENARFRNEVVPGSGGPAPFSEPEVVALRDFIQDVDPVAVVFWEALYRDGLVSPGRCGARSAVSYDLARVYGRAADYSVDDFEIDTGQILNGDSTNWLDAAGIPAVAVLLPGYETVDWAANWAGVLAVMETAAD